MNLYFAFDIALILCLLNTLVMAQNNPDTLDCSRTITVPANLRCTQLQRGPNVNAVLTRAVTDTALKVLTQCPKSVDILCRNLPELVKKYTAGGVERCKSALNTHMCNRINIELGNMYCAYKHTVTEIFARSNKWPQGRGSELCKYFEPNETICSVVTQRLCQQIRNVLSRTYCRQIIGRSSC